MLAHPVLKVVLVIGFSSVRPPAGPAVRRVITELHLLRVLRSHHFLLRWEEALELAQTVGGEPAWLGELYL